KDSSSFENLAEGYINCIRVLKEDNLKFYVLQYYEDFLRIALEREEYHAAATVFREAADYARRVGLIYDRGYMKRAAETWWKAAEKNERDGSPVEITENAYLAAIDAYNSVGDFFHVRESYKQLAKLALGEKKQKRYADVVARYAEVWQEAIDAAPFPDYLRQQHAYPEIWYLDLVEWELDGDHREVCASIIGDVRYADIIRRRALNVLLTHFDARPKDGTELDPHTLAQIAQDMGQLQAYAALQPLERLSTHANPEVRRGVMRALRHLFFKRTFNMIQRGLRDEAQPVRQAALEALKALHFPHAFDPLTRIFREHDDATVKEVALESIARIGSLEAGEFLVEVLRYEAEPLRQVARRQLAAFDNPDIFPILRKHLELETSGPARQALEQIVRAAGTRASA
ncbi:MAG TPA: HEAT repeat domain-containing protein, partial [Polyangia bacterium]